LNHHSLSELLITRASLIVTNLTYTITSLLSLAHLYLIHTISSPCVSVSYLLTITSTLLHHLHSFLSYITSTSLQLIRILKIIHINPYYALISSNSCFNTIQAHNIHYSIFYSHSYSYLSSAILTINCHVAYILILYLTLQYLTGLAISSSCYSSLLILIHTHTPVFIIFLVLIHLFKSITNNIIHHLSYLHLSVLFPVHLLIFATTITGYSLSHNYLSYEALIIIVSYLSIAIHYSYYLFHTLCALHIILSIVLVAFIAIHLILLHYSSHRYLHSVSLSHYYSLPFIDILLTDTIFFYLFTILAITSIFLSSIVTYLPYCSSLHSIPNIYYIHAFLAVTYISLPVYLIVPVLYCSIHYQ
jgi:hypothetical protein